MGSLFAKALDMISGIGGCEKRILMLGLDAAGKTTVLYRLNLGETQCTVPTIGFNVETVQYKKIKMTMWDVGGQERIRCLWKHYYENTDGIIFVVDSNDRARVEVARAELHHLLKQDELRNACVLVYSNKQDLPNSMTSAELATKMDLHSIRARQWYIQDAVATTGQGLHEGLDWLGDTLSAKAR